MSERKSRRILALVIGIVLLAVGLMAGWWAGRATMSPQASLEEREHTVEVQVVDGRVGRSMGIGVSVQQPVVPVATNTLSGMVTQISEAGEREVGDTVYVVAGTPVRVIEGDVPFYRPLSSQSQGDDVRQLQQALVDLGYLSSEPDGIFGAATRNAVRAWQADLGIERTGTIELGEVLAVPQLPTRIRAGEDIVLGTLLSGGEVGVLASGGERQFRLLLSNDQAVAITTDVPIIVYYEDYVWDAISVGSSVDENNYIVYDLEAPAGGLVCGDECDALPPDGQLSLRGEAIVVPDVRGPTVPVTAVRTDLSGDSYVLLPGGERQPVTVLGSSQGLAVVEGVEVGDYVVVIGEETESDAEATPPDDPEVPTETPDEG